MQPTDNNRKRIQQIVIGTLVVLGLLLLIPSNHALAQTKERYYSSFSTNVQRGIIVGVDNRTTGPITISGWDRDVIEARAVSSRGAEIVLVGRAETSGVPRLFLKADYANLEQPATPTVPVDKVPVSDDKVVQIRLEVRVPRYTEIERIEVFNSDVQVSDVETSIVVSGRSSTITLKRVGAADVQTRDGNVEIEGVNGLASVVTASGGVRVSKSKRLVHVVSIIGPIEVSCSSGRVDVSNTGSPITLANIDGDVDAIATNSNVTLSGNLREGARYYLKSMSGRVEMELPGNPRGFTSTLSSYRGRIENDFELDKKITKQGKQTIVSPEDRRVIQRFGNGKTQVLLDSFEGLVRLTKVEEASIPACK